MEKRTFRAERRTYAMCDQFQCIYADEADCHVASDRNKAVSECPSKLVYCAKAYCSHCAKFKTELCPREGKKPAPQVTVVIDKPAAKSAPAKTAPEKQTAEPKKQ